ncbi:hypothetical protein FRC19_011877 [Serendipita sp. 401]|nr:hypothetical protein FRC19_011877 [Serendipita sp. 401]
MPETRSSTKNTEIIPRVRRKSAKSGAKRLALGSIVTGPRSLHSSFKRLSAELFLIIAEFLDLRSRIYFSQAFRAVYHLSISRYSFWKGSGIAPITLPRIVEESEHTCRELRGAAIKTLRLKENLGNKEVRSFRKVQIPILNSHDSTFYTQLCRPVGTRWLFQFGHKPPGYSSIINAYDLLKERTVGSTTIPARVQIVESYQISTSKFALAVLSHTPDRHESIDIYTATFKAVGKKGKITVEFDKYRTICAYNSVSVEERFDFQDGWVLWFPDHDETIFYVERWDDPHSKRTFQTRPNSMFFQAMIGGPHVLALTSRNLLEVFELPPCNPGDVEENENRDETITTTPVKSFLSTMVCECIHPNHINAWQFQDPKYSSICGGSQDNSVPRWSFILEPARGVAFCKSWELPTRQDGREPDPEHQTTHGNAILTNSKSDSLQGVTLSETGWNVMWPDFKAKTYKIQPAGPSSSKPKKLILGSKRTKGPWKFKEAVFFDDSAGMIISDHDAYYQTLHWLF